MPLDYHTESPLAQGKGNFKLRHFAVVATIDRGSITTRMHRWPMMIYVRLSAKSMETKHNRHIHEYGTPIYHNVVYIFKPISVYHSFILKIIEICFSDIIRSLNVLLEQCLYDVYLVTRTCDGIYVT